jgi:prepilin-type N-terminal cleavage/methylation domain-containing protein
MNKRKGFTLVELLVVIAIIALLMSILMPALAKVRKQAKSVMCMTNLKQWGSIFEMYAGANDGFLVPGSFGCLTTDRFGQWMDALRPYYQEPDLRLCPSATKPKIVGGLTVDLWGADKAWGIYPYSDTWCTEGDYGSYGINGWVMNPSESCPTGWLPPEDFWRRIDVSGASIIPLFIDSQHFDTYPTNYSQPPEFEGQPWGSTEPTGEMERVCLNRHEGYVNCVFMNLSVRKVGLKELWKLKWHRTFDLNFDEPIWWPWMDDLKDY